MPNERTMLERLYHEEGKCVWGYVRRRIADSHDADEVFQQVFLVLASRPDRISAVSSARAWLLGIARNVVLEYWRRKGRARFDSLSEEVEAPHADEADERLSAMRNAISKLPELQREVLELRLIEELSYDAIAAMLNVPLGTVRSRIHNAFTRLHKELILNFPMIDTTGAGVRK